MSDCQVLILMGSDSDAPIMKSAVDMLDQFGISNEMTVASAHRSPARVLRLVEEADGRGVQVFIVGAGAAAHLAGVVAAHTTKPVIGVPIDATALSGMDALLATVQMPFIIVLVWHAWHESFDRHKRLARWIWPVWMFVSVSGVVVYLMLYKL